MAVLDGKRVAEEIQQNVRREIESLRKQHGQVPGLAVILAGDDPASKVYVGSKKRLAEKLGIVSRPLEFSVSVGEAEITAAVSGLNHDHRVDAILIQLPLPAHLDTWKILAGIDPDKDADCLHPCNQGLIQLNRAGIFPCTPAGVLRILDFYKIDVAGKNVVVIGRSVLVGKPVAAMLTNRHATVTLCHSRTRGLAEISLKADLIVAATGKPGLVTAEMVKPGSVLVDVGINRIDSEDDFRRFADPALEGKFRQNGHLLVGDIDFRAYAKAADYTPVPGGVGPMTVAMLMSNTLELFKRHVRQ